MRRGWTWFSGPRHGIDTPGIGHRNPAGAESVERDSGPRRNETQTTPAIRGDLKTVGTDGARLPRTQNLPRAAGTREGCSGSDRKDEADGGRVAVRIGDRVVVSGAWLRRRRCATDRAGGGVERETGRKRRRHAIGERRVPSRRAREGHVHHLADGVLLARLRAVREWPCANEGKRSSSPVSPPSPPPHDVAPNTRIEAASS